MSQKTTYGQGRVTEAQRRAAKERSKERARIAEAEKREALRLAGEAELARIGAEIVRERMKRRVPVDTAAIEAEAEARLAQEEADRTRLAELVREHEKGTKLFYSRMEKVLSGIEDDKACSDEARLIAGRLGINNPVSATVMQISGAAGFVADRPRFVEELLGKFSQLYRANNGQIIPSAFEGRRAKKSRREIANE